MLQQPTLSGSDPVKHTLSVASQLVALDRLKQNLTVILSMVSASSAMREPLILLRLSYRWMVKKP